MTWDSKDIVEVAVHRTYNGIMCGMCGDMDGIAMTGNVVDDFFDMNMNAVSNLNEEILIR